MAHYVDVDKLKELLMKWDFYPSIVRRAIEEAERDDLQKIIHAHFVWKWKHIHENETLPAECPHCGQKFVAYRHHDYMSSFPYCSNCGGVLDNAGAKFCQNCGAIFDEPEVWEHGEN